MFPAQKSNSPRRFWESWPQGFISVPTKPDLRWCGLPIFIPPSTFGLRRSNFPNNTETDQSWCRRPQRKHWVRFSWSIVEDVCNISQPDFKNRRGIRPPGKYIYYVVWLEPFSFRVSSNSSHTCRTLGILRPELPVGNNGTTIQKGARGEASEERNEEDTYLDVFLVWSIFRLPLH